MLNKDQSHFFEYLGFANPIPHYLTMLSYERRKLEPGMALSFLKAKQRQPELSFNCARPKNSTVSPVSLIFTGRHINNQLTLIITQGEMFKRESESFRHMFKAMP